MLSWSWLTKQARSPQVPLPFGPVPWTSSLTWPWMIQETGMEPPRLRGTLEWNICFWPKCLSGVRWQMAQSLESLHCIWKLLWSDSLGQCLPQSRVSVSLAEWFWWLVVTDWVIAHLGVDHECRDVPKIYFTGIILHCSLGNRFKVFWPRKTCQLSTSILVALFLLYCRFHYCY